ncbi:unnamed protein product [Eruca vesicaria subsp. sativa]|uniref:Uncharacterized protein n=1 Tax=Eruca vesicaria subsp. sativa TaxID=29727 RepID=A0ABC8JM32_ERUVS|nr:unnamed protein product [Eruca vesicaria subsp. sativa]
MENVGVEDTSGRFIPKITLPSSDSAVLVEPTKRSCCLLGVHKIDRSLTFEEEEK